MTDIAVAHPGPRQEEKHVQQKSLLRKTVIATVSKCLLRLYQDIRDERTRLLQEEYAQKQEKFSAFGDIEVCAGAIEGIATEITRRGRHHAPEKAMQTLEQNSLFASPEFTWWFSQHAGESPGYSLYVSLIDYLRTLVIAELRQEEQGVSSDDAATTYLRSHVLTSP